MAHMCDECSSSIALVRCVPEFRDLCLNCDYQRHCEGDGDNAGHTRYQICEECMMCPAILQCSDDNIILCQGCYSYHYNCVADGHRTQIINPFRQEPRTTTTTTNHDANNNNNNNHMPPLVVVSYQRRPRMFEMSCNGNNNCERCMFSVDCESCSLSNGNNVYCPQHNMVLCENCDRMYHVHNAVPPHLRCMLCETCKRPSHAFLIGAGYRFYFPPPSDPPPE